MLSMCTSSGEVNFLKEWLHRMGMSPNSLHQTKEQKFQIYLVMQISLSMVEKYFLKWVFQQKLLTFFVVTEETTPPQLKIQATHQP